MRIRFWLGSATRSGVCHTLVWAWLAALAAWLVVMIATPLFTKAYGSQVFPMLASLGVLTHLAASLAALSIHKTPRWILKKSAVTLVITYSIELLGSTTGFPFGSYVYTTALQPQILGVPLIIPLAWLMMLIPAWSTAAYILGDKRHRLVFAALTGLVFTAWDFYLDPHMVAHGLWRWQQPEGYFGIPWTNFLGWWLSSAALTWIINPQQMTNRPALVIYSLTWLFYAVGLAVIWSQPGPALTGVLGMGIFVWWGWKKALAVLG